MVSPLNFQEDILGGLNYRNYLTSTNSTPRNDRVDVSVFQFNLINVETQKVQHRVYMDHIRADVQNAEDEKKDTKADSLLNASKRDSEKGKKISNDVTHCLTIMSAYRGNFDTQRIELSNSQKIKTNTQEA